VSAPQPAVLLGDLLAAAANEAGLRELGAAAFAAAAEAVAEIGRLAAAPDAEVTFDAVFGALDRIQHVIRTTRGLGQLLGEVHPDAGVRAAARAGEAGADRLETELYLDPALSAAVKRVAAAGPLDGPRARLVDQTLQALRRSGLDLPAAEQAELRRLNEQITRVGQRFLANLAEAEGRVEIAPASLDGLPAEYVADHLSRALPNGNVVVNTDSPDLLPFIKYATDRAAARALYAALDDRAAAENVPLLERLLALRERKARLLGYATWADYAIEPRMAKEVGAVRRFLETVRDAVQAPARAELERFRDMHVALGGRRDDPLYPPDRYYLEERERAARYGYDSRELSRYFEVTAVRDGLFALSARLFGLAYRRVDDAVLWHADVEAYDVWSGDRRIGRIVLDLYPRAGKFKHAATFEVRPAWRAPPIGALVCNFPRPGGERPALLTHDEVVVFFHEFGHLLHEILSEAPFAVFAGEAVARDFVEVPSQVFEEWAWRREVLDLFARHHETGERIPDALFESLCRARRVGRALFTEIQLFLATLDLEYHSRPAGFDTTELLRETFAACQPFAFLEGTHYQATFVHLVSYDAGYYGYQWALALAADVVARFEAEGFANRALAGEWRAAVLSRGGSDDEGALIERFLGRKPNPAAYIEQLRRSGE